MRIANRSAGCASYLVRGRVSARVRVGVGVSVRVRVRVRARVRVRLDRTAGAPKRLAVPLTGYTGCAPPG